MKKFDTSEWKCYYKIDPVHKSLGASNMLYTPLINPTGDIMCMHYDISSPYQSHNIRLTEELMDFFFEREVTHINIFKDYKWFIWTQVRKHAKNARGEAHLISVPVHVHTENSNIDNFCMFWLS